MGWLGDWVVLIFEDSHLAEPRAHMIMEPSQFTISSPSVGTAFTAKETIMQSVVATVIIDILVLGLCALWYSAVARGNGTTIMRSYAKLSDEDKARYDLDKIKCVQKDFIIFLCIVLMFIFTSMVWGPSRMVVTVNCLLLVIVALIRGLMDYSGFFLTLFCQK